MNKKLYSTHLDRVSRSFAFCISQMRSPEREYIGLAYILCRIADTIEDSYWDSPYEQNNSFLSFMNFIRQNPEQSSLRNWQQKIPPTATKNEKKLIHDASNFFNDLHELPLEIKKHIQRCVLDMVGGMMHFSKHYRQGSELKLTTDAETNQYCFFVAGIVGELLTLVMTECIANFKMTEDVLLNSFHFGLYLQKINLLKDHEIDASEGRHFFHNYEDQRTNIKVHAIRSLNYIFSIPIEAADYRLFCAWSLFLGLASLNWIDKSRQENAIFKIPRTEAMFVFSRIKKIINSNQQLEDAFNKYLKNKPEDKINIAQQNSAPDNLWFTKIYTGQLEKKHMFNLGLV